MSWEQLVTSALGFTTGFGLGAVVLWRGYRSYRRRPSPEELVESTDSQ